MAERVWIVVDNDSGDIQGVYGSKSRAESASNWEDGDESIEEWVVE